MDYEKLYKESLEKAKAFAAKYVGDGLLISSEGSVAKEFNEIFQELRESDDEKWRKWLIGHLKGYISQTDNKYAEVCKKAIVWLEKQGEQKPTNEVKTKFKIEKGKWYVCIKNLLDNYANTAFCEGNTYLSTQDGSLIPSNSNVPFEVTCPDVYFRDWTIQDAKDGDVLASKDGDDILIFRNIEDNVTFSSYYNIARKGEHYWSKGCAPSAGASRTRIARHKRNSVALSADMKTTPTLMRR